MIHPSYVEMIEQINKGQDPEEAPLVTSRYSIVLATAKRARQLIAGAEPMVRDIDKNGSPRKPLSIAVDELYEDKVHIIARDENTDEQ
ncbi:MAG: DNA-directed RNA polymerase subunit omega [Eubacterium sp.]|nr:DNA-directed RNA polymerase subunit omega [Eubacterium sp.]